MPVNGTAYVEVDVIYLFWHMNVAYIMIFEVLALLGSHIVFVGTCLTDVSKQPIRSIFKSQTILNLLTLEDETVPKLR